jgi:hypothetical protein
MILSSEQMAPALMQLRRAHRRHPDDPDLADARAAFERATGPTVSRAASARLLGVSQTAIDRRIAAGDVPVVMTASGRWEVPLTPLLDLLEAVEQRRRRGSLRPLAAVVRDRRGTAGEPVRSDAAHGGGGHRRAELRGRAYHEAIAGRIDDAAIADALVRLRRWRGEGRIHPTYADAWEGLLSGPRERLLDALRADDERAVALRQSSPLAGLLDERERRALLDLDARGAT